MTDAVGTIASYVYDADDRLVEVRDGQGRTLLKEPLRCPGTAARPNGRAGPGGCDGLPHNPRPGVLHRSQRQRLALRKYENGRLTQTTDPLGNSVHYAYDAAGNLTGVTDERGNTTTFSYDQSGNLTQIQSPSGATTRVF